MENKEFKTISEDEMKVVEAEVAKKQAEALKSKYDEQARDIEAKVRKEMETKMEADKLREKLEAQEKELAKFKEDQDARMKAQEEAFKKQLEDALAVKKGLSKNESPFAGEESNMKKLSDGTEIDLSRLNHEEIEEQSRQAFMRAFGIQDQNFGKPLVRYR